MLQAHTEEEFQAWVSAIQSGVSRAYREAERRQDEQREVTVLTEPLQLSTVVPHQ